jgi:diguanylate cyclase (GGDEF)-like protein/PAS domain S-box-containing protein
MSDTLDDDAAFREDEHESLLGFFYMCPIGVLRMNLEGDIDLANPHAAQYMLAITRQPAMDNFFTSFEQCAPELRHMVRMFSEKSGVICEQHRIFIRASGPGIRVLACSIIKSGPSVLMAVLQDITKQVEQERQLAQNDVLLDALLAGVNDFSLFSVDEVGLIETWNAAGARQLGYSGSEVKGKPVSLFYRPNDPTRGKFSEQIAAAAQEGWHVQDGWCERRDGSRFSCQMMVTVGDEHTEQPGSFTVVLRDVTERRMTTDELRKLLTTDQMTGAFNRGRFFELAKHHIYRCEKGDRPLSVIMFDVDHFKATNDNFGHAVGDEVLRRLVTCCKAQLGEGGILGRLGGEEFAVLLPDTAIEGAKSIAERLRVAAAADLAAVAGSPTLTTVSLGCVAAKRPMGGIDDLLKSADKALYDAKRSGRNRVCAA